VAVRNIGCGGSGSIPPLSRATLYTLPFGRHLVRLRNP
jgi:hypothetical protein